MAALRALPGIAQAFSVARQPQTGRAEADTNARFVHHVEHVGQPLSRFPDQLAFAAVVLTECEDGVGGAAVAHFMVQADQPYVVGGADLSGRIGAPLGHDEDRDALGACRCAFDAGEDEVDDVVAEFVIACGNPHLLTAQLVATGLIRDRGRRGADIGEARACVRFGEAHGAEEPTFEHGRQPVRLLLRGCMSFDQVGCTNRQEGVACRRDVGGLEKRRSPLRHSPGQGQPPVFLIVVSGEKARFAVGIHGLGDLGDQLDHAVDHTGFVQIALAVVRGKIVVGDLARGFQHRFVGLPVVRFKAR